MNFKQADINRFFKTPDQNIRCVLLFGTNEGMIAELCDKFMKTVCDDLNDAFRVSILQMDAVEKDAGLLFGEYNAVSLMGGRRVVLIKDVNDKLTKPLKELMANTNSDTMLVMTSGTINTKSSLVSYLKNEDFAAVFGCYDDREENINSYVRDFFIQNKITIASDAMQLLCRRLSTDRKASLNELEKLLSYIGAKKNVVLEDVQKAVSDTSGSSLEDLSYYAASGQTERAVAAYQFLLNEGEEPVQLLRNLTYHFLRLLECVADLEKGSSVESVVSGLRPPLMFYRKSDFMMQLKIWKRKALFDVLSLLYKAERDCKTTGYPAEEIGSWTVMQISGAARKLKNAYNG